MDIILVAGSYSHKLTPHLAKKNYNVIQEFQTATEAFVTITNNDIIYFDKLLLLDNVLSAEKSIDEIFDKLGRLFTLGKCKDKEFIIIAKNESTINSFNVHFKNYPNFKIYTANSYSMKLIEDALLGAEDSLTQVSQVVQEQPQPQQPIKQQPIEQNKPKSPLFNRRVKQEEPQQEQVLTQAEDIPQQPISNVINEDVIENTEVYQQQQKRVSLFSKRIADDTEQPIAQEPHTNQSYEQPQSLLENKKGILGKKTQTNRQSENQINRNNNQENETTGNNILPVKVGGLLGKKGQKNSSANDANSQTIDIKQKVVEHLRNSNITNKSILIGVTGLGGSGKTMITANLGYALSCYNVDTCIVDLNIFDRGINLYYPSITDEYYAETTNDFLYKALFRPDEASAYTLPLNSSLSVLSLPFGYDLSHQEIERFNSDSIKRILANLKLKFNVIIVDIPFKLLEEMEDLCLIFDKILMISRDNIYGISQLCGYYDPNRIENSMTRNIFMGKVNYILNFYTGNSIYGDTTITKDNFLYILAESLDTNNLPGIIAGCIPYIQNLDRYLYSDKSIMYKDKNYQKYIDEIILNISI